jgi:integrase
MAGSIWKQGDRYVVGWWNPERKRQEKITKHWLTGMPFYAEQYAVQARAEIRAEKARADQGLCVFRIERFTGKLYTDVPDFFETWMRDVIEPKRKPATIKGYWSYYRNWIKPFFETHRILLHEIRLDTLTTMLNSITLSGKGKYNVMNCFHSMMDYAWRSERIPEMPPFPKKEDYNVVVPSIKWLTEDRQMAIIDAIPEIHRPIFLWLKYHYRRPAEACALMVEDYDRINGAFLIRRSVSARKIVSATKTGAEHIVPCDFRFKSTADRLSRNGAGHFFTNPLARRESKRYTNESLNIIWRKACKKAGEKIDLYSGLKHSSCSQLVNETGLALSDVQVLTDHARLDSVKRYAKVGLARKRELMARAAGVIDLGDYQKTTKKR